jgi:hypothetical protein
MVEAWSELGREEVVDHVGISRGGQKPPSRASAPSLVGEDIRGVSGDVLATRVR